MPGTWDPRPPAPKALEWITWATHPVLDGGHGRKSSETDCGRQDSLNFHLLSRTHAAGRTCAMDVAMCRCLYPRRGTTAAFSMTLCDNTRFAASTCR